jgi:glycyl-tRNA synthetase beta chain
VREEFAADFDTLSVAFKRSRNILKGIPEYPLAPERFLPEGTKEGDGERALFAAVESVKGEAESLLDGGKYTEALRKLAGVRPAVDKFFDDVLVMCDPEGKDPDKTALQQNRLALLQRLVGLFNRVADFSEIVPRGAN